MIDFRKKITRIKKYSVEEGDFYLKVLSSAEIKKVYSDNEDNEKESSIESIMKNLIDISLCDEKGDLILLTIEELEELPRSLVKDIADALQNMLGEKKS